MGGGSEVWWDGQFDDGKGVRTVQHMKELHVVGCVN